MNKECLKHCNTVFTFVNSVYYNRAYDLADLPKLAWEIVCVLIVIVVSEYEILLMLKCI